MEYASSPGLGDEHLLYFDDDWVFEACVRLIIPGFAGDNMTGDVAAKFHI